MPDEKAAFEIQGSARLLREDGGEIVEGKSDPFIKFSVWFRDEWLRKLKGAKLGVFVCLALHIDEANESYPSVKTISKETGYSNHEIIDTVKELEDLKLIKVLRTPGDVNRYILHPTVAYGKKSVHVGGVKKVHTPSGGSEENSTTTSEENSRGDVNSYAVEVEPVSRTIKEEPIAAAAKREFLKLKGVGKPALDQIAQDPGIELPYLEAHFQHGNDRGDSIPLIIHRIKSGDAAPKMQELFEGYWNE